MGHVCDHEMEGLSAFAMISKFIMTNPFTDSNLCFLFLNSQTSSFQTA